MKGNRKQSIEIKDFSGGYVTKSPPKNIENKFSIDCVNVYSEGAMLRVRPGFTAYTATAGSGNGIYNWTASSTSQYLIGFWGTTLTRMSVSGGSWDNSWATITAHSASGTTFTSGGFMHFSNFNGVLIMATEGYDVIQRQTVAESSYFNLITGGTGTAPRSKYLINWKNHMWFINCLNSEDRVAHSSVNSYNNFTGDTYGTNDLLTENDVGLTGGFVLNGRMYITKAFSVHRFTYTGSPSPLVEIREIKSTMGTKSPRTIRKINTAEGEMVLMLGTDRKLYMCDGIDLREISDAIDISNGVGSVYMQNINANALGKCHAVIHQDLNWYELFICIGTTTTPTMSIVYDYMTKAFWPMDNRIFSTAVVADNGSGQRRVFAQQTTTGVAVQLNSTNADAGVAITYRHVTPKIGFPISLTKIDEIEVETDSVACTPTFSWRADWESSWIDNTLRASQNTHNFGPNRMDNMIQFKISGSSTDPSPKFWTILASERAVGGGK